MVGFALEINVTIDRAVVLAEGAGDELDADPDTVGKQCGPDEAHEG